MAEFYLSVMARSTGLSPNISNAWVGYALKRHPDGIGSSVSFPFKKHNMALNRAPFGRWTLRDKAAQRRLALR